MASSAVPASATTSNPSSPSSNRRRPLRTTAWSSASTILIASAIAGERNYERNCGELRMCAGPAAPRLCRAMTTRVLIAGGGVAALEALLALRADARDLVDVTLVADSEAFSYRSLQVGEAF